MLGKLSEVQIEDLLEQQVTGRIGCHAEGVTYIVPINYGYKDGCIYGHSAKGKKIEMLRNNPEVCFQVDKIESILKWKSVIGWGLYEEISKREDLHKAMQVIISHLVPYIKDSEGHPSHGITEKETDVGSSVDLILYKICLKEKTGRFEDPDV